MKLSITIPASVTLEFNVEDLAISKKDLENLSDEGIYNYELHNDKLDKLLCEKLEELLEKHDFLNIDETLESYSCLTN